MNCRYHTHRTRLLFLVPQSPQEHTQHGVRLQIEDEVRAAGEDGVGALTMRGRLRDVRVPALARHAEGERLERVPRAAAAHRLVRDVGDGVRELAAHDAIGLLRERADERALERGERLVGEMVVEREPVVLGRVLALEEEAAEEDEGEGAHDLAVCADCKLRQRE